MPTQYCAGYGVTAREGCVGTHPRVQSFMKAQQAFADRATRSLQRKLLTEMVGFLFIMHCVRMHPLALLSSCWEPILVPYEWLITTARFLCTLPVLYVPLIVHYLTNLGAERATKQGDEKLQFTPSLCSPRSLNFDAVKYLLDTKTQTNQFIHCASEERTILIRRV